MSPPTCCCSVSLGRCDRHDLLVDLEGFHPMIVVRTPNALVLDRESCDRCAGCPSCGVTCSRSRVRRGGGDRRALGPGSRCGSGGTIRRWICCERTCQTVTFLEHSEKVCAPRVWVCGRSAGRSDSCTSREPPLQDWPDNWQPRGTPRGPLSSRACTHLVHRRHHPSRHLNETRLLK